MHSVYICTIPEYKDSMFVIDQNILETCSESAFVNDFTCVIVAASLNQLTDIFYLTHFIFYLTHSKTKSLFNPRPASLSHSRFLPSPHVAIHAKHPSWIWRKLISILAQRWSNWTRFLPNTVSSPGHSNGSRWQVFAKLQPSPTFMTRTRNGVVYITRPIFHLWASIESSFFGHFHSGCFF